MHKKTVFTAGYTVGIYEGSWRVMVQVFFIELGHLEAAFGPHVADAGKRPSYFPL